MCQNVAYRFENFSLEPISKSCSTGDELIYVNSETYESGPICANPAALYDWTRVDSANFDIMLRGVGGKILAEIRFLCVEDLLGLPTCAQSGDVFYEYTGVVEWSTVSVVDTVPVGDNEMDCPNACWDKPGCGTFTFSQTTGCTIYMGTV